MEPVKVDVVMDEEARLPTKDKERAMSSGCTVHESMHCT
jgi:hypothetical protein